DDDSSSDPDDVIKIEDSLLMDPFYTDAQPRDDSPELDAPADSCKDCDQLVAFQDEDSTDDTQTTLTFGDFAAAESSSDVDSEVWAVSVDQDLGGAKSATDPEECVLAKKHKESFARFSPNMPPEYPEEEKGIW
ncbi:unnamed protein product, partial [Effrenium voratum]